MEDKGLKLALKAKRRGSKTSMAVGMDLVLNGEADTFVTAGNTGGALATAYYRLGTIPGVERPALTALFPVKTGYCVVLDIGANPECKPDHLLQFAMMGAVYAERVRGIHNPRVGLLSNGEEAGKGNELVKGTYPLLEASGLNFIGNVEGKELFGGNADVVVTDGFTGNILLKSSEAVGKLIVDVLRQELMSSTRTKLGAAAGQAGFWQDQAACSTQARSGRRRCWASMDWYLSGMAAPMPAPWSAPSVPPARRCRPIYWARCAAPSRNSLKKYKQMFRVKKPRRFMDNPPQHTRVVITGLGAVSPLGASLEQYWDGLLQGRSGVRRITQFDASNLPCQIAGEIPDFDVEMYMDRKEARRTPPRLPDRPGGRHPGRE